MMGVNISSIDQTLILFLFFTAIGLVRERRVLPFVLALIGNLFFGPISAIILGVLIIWNSIDSACSKWIQLKNIVGLLFLIIAAVAPEPLQEFSVLLGCIFFSFSFSLGGLGVLPAALLLRQYIQHPNPIELTWIALGIYLATVELVRWSKTKHERLILTIMETISSGMLIYALKDSIGRLIEEPTLLVLSSGIFSFVFILFAWIKWKGDSFWTTYHRFSEVLRKSFLLGNKIITDKAWNERPGFEEEETPNEKVFNRIFLMIVIFFSALVCFVIASRGGLL